MEETPFMFSCLLPQAMINNIKQVAIRISATILLIFNPPQLFNLFIKVG